MNVSDLIEKQFNVKTTYDINPLVSQIGVTKVRFLPYNPRRLAFTFVNLSAGNVWVAPDSSVASTRGIMLVPNGGSLSVSWTEDMEMSTLEWYGIAAGAAYDIFVLETLIQ